MMPASPLMFSLITLKTLLRFASPPSGFPLIFAILKPPVFAVIAFSLRCIAFAMSLMLTHDFRLPLFALIMRCQPHATSLMAAMPCSAPAIAAAAPCATPLR